MEETSKKGKLSYEELENVCHQLSAQAQQLNAQNQQLRTMLNDANLNSLYKRLDYLFKITQEENLYITDTFRQQCGEEIESLMARPGTDTEEEQQTGEE